MTLPVPLLSEPWKLNDQRFRSSITPVEFGSDRVWCCRCKDRPATISFATLGRTMESAACTRCAGMVILELGEAGFGRFVYDLVDAA